MKTRTQIALLGCLLSIFVHLYLTLHYYPLKLGMAAGNSICNVGGKFDCDAVSASSFSAMFGIPMAVWGAVTNAVLFFLILVGWLEWSERPERLRRSAAALAGLTFAASIVMGAISLLFMQSYCLFCISVYILSAIVFFSYIGVLREPFWKNLSADLPHLWSESRGTLIAFAAIPVLAFTAHKVFLMNLGADRINEVVRSSIADWQTAPKYDFVAKPSLTMGPATDQSDMTIVEFADFRCPHCKHASYTLHAFIKSHPDVRFEFYTFPLGGECTDKFDGNSGASCRLAATVLCAEKEGKGWQMHDALFAAQEQVNASTGLAQIDSILAQQCAQLGLNWQSLQHCMTDADTIAAINAQAKQGNLVNVEGTPTLFANGRQLKAGQFLPVLQEAHKISAETKKL